MRGVLFLLIILSQYILFAQDGPGGVGNSTANGLWLRADALDSANADTITIWSDLSGNMNDASATGTERPIFYETSSLNSQPIVRLDGNDDQLTVMDDPILDGTSGINYFVVLRPNNLDNEPRGILGKRRNSSTSAGYAYTWFFWNNDYLNMDLNTQNNRFNTSPISFSNSTNYLLQLDYDGTRSFSQRSRIYSAGEMIEQGNETSTSVLASSEDLTIGALNFNYRAFLGADYAEVIHYNFSLNETERAIVNNYLSAKYDIATRDDIYLMDNSAAGNYDHDVAGIGRLGSEIHNDSRGSGIVRISNPSGLDDNEFLFWGHDNGALDSIETDVPTGINSRLVRVWRVSEVDSAESSVDVGSITVRFDLSDLGPVTTSHLRLLVDSDNDGSFADETPISGASSLGGDEYQFTGVTAITDSVRFTLGSTNAVTPLPVDMQFTEAAFTSENTVELEWITFSELNNLGFEIKRRYFNSEWETIGFIRGKGVSNETNTYSFKDHRATRAKYSYQLKQLDIDGTYSYSEIKTAKHKTPNHTKISIYPNPTKGFVTIEGDDIQQIQLLNVTGDVLQETRVNQNKTVLPLPENLTGTYLIKILTLDGRTFSKRLIILD